MIVELSPPVVAGVLAVCVAYFGAAVVRLARGVFHG